MTCEVAVMNKRGIALAADSAVTLGEGRKIYHTAEKLFSLSPSVPIAIMTFGAADLMNVPWETVIKIYAQKLGNRRFDTVEQHAEDFLAFIEGATALFPTKDQEEYVRRIIGTAWSDLYRDKLLRQFGQDSNATESEIVAALSSIIRSDHQLWIKEPDIDELSPDYGTLVVRTYEQVIRQVQKDIFGHIKLNEALRSDLRKTVSFLFQKQWPEPFESGVVVAGMGEAEPFPVLVHYNIGTIAAGKLRYTKSDDTRIGDGVDAVVEPFAQRETIDMIISGIHPTVRDQLINDAGRWVTKVSTDKKGKDAKLNRKVQNEFANYIERQISERYGPVMNAVSALPRQDLAKMAEALVSLTAFLMRMSADKDETVAEPIDVALLSKGDGFIWVKHKEL